MLDKHLFSIVQVNDNLWRAAGLIDPSLRKENLNNLVLAEGETKEIALNKLMIALNQK